MPPTPRGVSPGSHGLVREFFRRSCPSPRAPVGLNPSPVTDEAHILQQFVSEVTRIAREELRWLRMNHFHQPGSEEANAFGDWIGICHPRKMGDTVLYRKPVKFLVQDHGVYDLRDHYALAPTGAVHLIENASVDLDTTEALCQPYKEMSERFARPAAYAVAERIARSVRRFGGADVMISADQRLDVPEVDRAAAVQWNGEGDLGMRGMIVTPDPGTPVERHPFPYKTGPWIRIDMLYGLGRSDE